MTEFLNLSYSEFHDLLSERKVISKRCEEISVKWTTGGSWGDCWGGSGSIEPEEPEELTALEEVLEMINPNMTFFQFKRIRKEVVETTTESEGDYYGGCRYYLKVSANLRKLYDVLVSEGLIGKGAD